MIIEVLKESESCKDCQATKENHERLSKKHLGAAKTTSDKKTKEMYTNNGNFEKKLSLTGKCPKCKKKLSENFYAPRNLIATKDNLGSGTDDVITTRPNFRDKIYEPSQHDATQPEHKQNVNVPGAITAVLTSRAADARAHSEKLNVTQTEDKQFYSDLAQMFDDLNEYLKSGTVYDLKMASVFLTTLMGPMLYEVPSEVVRFIAYGGVHAPLKSFVNSITVPQGGFRGPVDQS